MKPTEKTAPDQTATLEFEFMLTHAPQKVWRALTDPTLLKQWLLPSIGLKLEQGASFHFQAPPQPGWDGSVRCRVLELEAPRMISYAWVVGDMDTVVTFTLTPITSGTRLSLVHSGFKAGQEQNFGGARYGWYLMGGKLFGVLDRAA